METHAFDMENDYDEQGEVEPTEDGVRITFPTFNVNGYSFSPDYDLTLSEARGFIAALIAATRDHQREFHP